MDPRRAQRLRHRLYNRWPLIGGWLRRRAARVLARTSTPPAAEILAEALTRSPDPRVRQLAAQALEGLAEPNAVDAACAVWANTRQEDLTRMLTRRRWVAQNPPAVRVLTALKNLEFETIQASGAEIVPPLVQACGDPDPQIIRAALESLPKLRHPEAIDALCALWVETRGAPLGQAMVSGACQPRGPVNVRVLVALKQRRLEVLATLGAEAVKPLVEAGLDPDGQIAEQALEALRQLGSPAAKDALCQLLIVGTHPAIERLALERRYLPQDEHQRALFLFLTGQWTAYDQLDFDHRLLAAAYQAADPPLRQRIIDQLKASGRTDLLTVVLGVGRRARVAVMTGTESEFLVNTLVARLEWERLWKLVFELAFAWSLRGVQHLAQSGWQPAATDERQVFEELVALAAQELVSSADELSALLPPAAQQARVRVKGNVNDVAFAPALPRIAIGTGTRKLVLWDFQHARIQEVFGGFDHSIGCVHFSRAGVLLGGERTTSDEPCALYAWRDGQRVRLGCHTGSITALEPAGETLVLVAGRDHRVCLWDSASGQSVADQSWPFWARGARAAHDGARAVLLHHGLTLLELPKLVEVARSPRYSWRGVCRAATFAPEGDALIVGKANGEVWVCRQEAGQLRPEPAPWRRHPQEVRGIELLPRRPVVITGAADGQIQFTSWPNRGAIGAVHNAGQRLTSLHVSPDGAFMVTGDSDATMSLWDLRALDVPRLFAQPLVQAVPAQLAAVSALLTDAALPAHARPPLRFLEVLLRHRFRFDIEVDELTSIQHGEFDIEVEG